MEGLPLGVDNKSCDGKVPGIKVGVTDSITLGVDNGSTLGTLLVIADGEKDGFRLDADDGSFDGSTWKNRWDEYLKV